MMKDFAAPAYLWALLLVPVLVGAYLLIQRRRQRYAVRFTNLDLLASVAPSRPGWRRHLPAAVWLLAIAALVVGLARPQASMRVPKDQATVVLVIDVSGSMRSQDVDPTRLGAAQEAATIFVKEVPARFQVGLVAFSSNVRVLASPTEDRQAVRDGLASLTPNGGTALGDAILAAVTLVRPEVTATGDAPGTTTTTPATPSTPAPARRPASILLLSDGAQTVGQNQPLDAADVAKQVGVPVYTVALGTEDGTADIPDNRGRSSSVRVPPDPATLRAVAERTDAKFFAAPTRSQLTSVYKDLGSKIGYTTQRRDATPWLAAVALALLLVGGAMSLLWFNRFP